MTDGFLTVKYYLHNLYQPCAYIQHSRPHFTAQKHILLKFTHLCRQRPPLSHFSRAFPQISRLRMELTGIAKRRVRAYEHETLMSVFSRVDEGFISILSFEFLEVLVSRRRSSLQIVEVLKFT